MWRSVVRRCRLLEGKLRGSVLVSFWCPLVLVYVIWEHADLLTPVCVVLCCVGGGGDLSAHGGCSSIRGCTWWGVGG